MQKAKNNLIQRVINLLSDGVKLEIQKNESLFSFSANPDIHRSGTIIMIQKDEKFYSKLYVPTWLNWFPVKPHPALINEAYSKIIRFLENNLS